MALFEINHNVECVIQYRPNEIVRSFYTLFTGEIPK